MTLPCFHHHALITGHFNCILLICNITRYILDSGTNLSDQMSFGTAMLCLLPGDRCFGMRISLLIICTSFSKGTSPTVILYSRIPSDHTVAGMALNAPSRTHSGGLYTRVP